MMGNLPRYRIRAVHLTVVWAFAVSQPVFSMLEGNPEFLVRRGSTRLDLVAFSVVVAFVPPLAAAAYAWLASRLSRWVGDMLYLVFLAAFLAPLVLQLTASVDPGRYVTLAVLLALCAAAIAAYVRWRAVRLFLTFAILLPMLGLASFMRGTPVADASATQLHAQVESDQRVVFVVLDELPLSSLLTSTGEIDAARFPSFGRLAREATWYPNATTVHEYTVAAVPSMLTGKMPNGGLPRLADHPFNLFTLLGESYSLKVHEVATYLCPETYCTHSRGAFTERIHTLISDVAEPYIGEILPSSLRLGTFRSIEVDPFFARISFSAVAEFDAFVDEMSRSRRTGTLHFMHSMLPHVPWRFLPSGRQYGEIHLDGYDRRAWGVDPWLAVQGLQRHLLQVQYTDRLLGRLIDRLDRLGLYDGSLLIVAADHGASFHPGDRRRDITEGNFADIANVPLFVKYPSQERGRVDPRPARTVDLLPTIADVVGVEVPWRTDGASLLGEPVPRSEAVVHRRDGSVIRLPLGKVRRHTAASARALTRVFGEGFDSLFHIGTNLRLLGTAVADHRLQARGPQSPTVRITMADELADVRPHPAVLPARIAGVVEEGRIAPGVELAVAVNGRIEALTSPYLVGDRQEIRALVPEAALNVGFNRVDVYAIDVRSRIARLTPLTSP